MTRSDIPDRDWIEFVRRGQDVIAKRAPGAPVCMIVCNEMDGANYQVHFLSHGLRDHHRIPIIGEMIESLAEKRPDMSECIALRDYFRKLFTFSGDVQDISKGLS